jgi:cobalamin-dependent methionine synthase I
MAIDGLKIIGESINDSVPSTNKLYEANDIKGLKGLAREQDEKGASFIDVNIGRRSPDFMAEMIKEVQSVTRKPLAVDTPDYKIAEKGLLTYDIEKAGCKIPILNSISPLRLEMFDLYKIKKFMPVLMVSERIEGNESKPNHTVEETYKTAKEMLLKAREYNIPNEELIFDVGIAPIASDLTGMTKRTLDSIKMIHDDEDFKGIHMSLGLSNFTVMLPSKCADGTPLKSSLESAFLTIANPNGLDMIIGSVKKNYNILDDNHPAMKCLNDVLKLESYDIIMRVKDFYS